MDPVVIATRPPSILLICLVVEVCHVRLAVVELLAPWTTTAQISVNQKTGLLERGAMNMMPVEWHTLRLRKCDMTQNKYLSTTHISYIDVVGKI